MSATLESTRNSTWLRRTCSLVCLVCLFVATAAASNFKVLYSPYKRQGAHFWSNLTWDSAGNLYGTTQFGGIKVCHSIVSGCGTVFELVPQPGGTWKAQILYKFQNEGDGWLPYAGVIFDAAGNLYGTTAGGGAGGYGTAYELSPGANGWTKTILHNFPSGKGDGGYPGPLVMDKKGNLYGTTQNGVNPCPSGTVFELSPMQGSWTETVLHCFTGTGSDGMFPDAPLIFDAAGNLYSTTYNGGLNGGGTAFELSPSGGKWKETILYNFGASSVWYYAPLVADASGNLYGVTFSGAVYELSPSNGGWTYTEIYTGQGGPTGIYPVSLIMDAAGNLYGTAEGGANVNCSGYGCGAVFKLEHQQSGWQLTVLYNFTGGPDGAYPWGGLIMDAQGNLFGGTYYGGKIGCINGCGVVYEITP